MKLLQTNGIYSKIYNFKNNGSNSKELSWYQVCLILKKMRLYSCDADKEYIDSFLNKSVDLEQIVYITDLLLKNGSKIPLEVLTSACCYANNDSEYHGIQRVVEPLYWMYGIRD